MAYIAKHSGDLAKCIDQAGGISLLILCMKEPEMKLKVMSLVCLTEIIKHSDEFAHSFIDKGGMVTLKQMIATPNTYVKKEALSCLAQIAKFNIETATKICDDENGLTFKNIVKCINDPDSLVQRNAAVLVSEIVKHGQQLHNVVTNTCGAGPFLEYAKRTKGYLRMPGLLIIKDLCTYEDSLVKQVIEKDGVSLLKESLENEETLYMKACIALTIYEIARKSPANAAILVKEGIPNILIDCYKLFKSAGEELQPAQEDLLLKTEKALEGIISVTEDIEFLEVMLDNAPIEIHRFVYPQIAKLLAKSGPARREFAMKGYLKKAIEKEAQADDSYVQNFLKHALIEIRNIYPLELTQIHGPGFIDNTISKWYNEEKQKEGGAPDKNTVSYTHLTLPTKRIV